MRIAIMAAGGVGGYFGGRLAAAGHSVHFLARGAHLAAMRKSGLRIESPLGNLHIQDVAVTDDPVVIGPVDAILFAVKLWDTDQAAEACNPLLGPETLVVPLQNGVSSMDVLTRHLGEEYVAGGVAHIAAVIAAPGLIRHSGTMARLTVGERDGRRSARIDALLAALKDAGIDHAYADDITRVIWEKFVFLSALSGLTTLCRQAIGPIRSDPDARALFEGAIGETAAVARAVGVKLADNAEVKTMQFTDGLPDGMKASMLHDLENGRRLELPWLSGEVVRLGRKRGIPTPVHSAVYGALKFYAAGT
ncbi:MAG TPA: 2-dehydropantoate 2-reductase [Hyphomicrobiales bacterium]|nr:2-dehydropantoate 2-reductase [Hyphomicrobiales bacterium]